MVVSCEKLSPPNLTKMISESPQAVMVRRDLFLHRRTRWTAKALCLTVPATFLVQADVVIE